MQNHNADISRVVRTLLALKGKEQVELARHLNLSEPTISRRLNKTGDHRRPWRVDELYDVADFLEVPVTLLLSDPDDLLKVPTSWFEAHPDQPVAA